MMNIFFDTNVILESLANRSHAAAVGKIFVLVESKAIRASISSGTIYTLAYLLERYLKEQGRRNPERIELLRSLLTSIASTFTIIDMSSKDYMHAIANPDFTDIEDSFQHQMAITNGCDAILTINVKDFKGVADIEVLTPAQLLNKIKNSENNNHI